MAKNSANAVARRKSPPSAKGASPMKPTPLVAAPGPAAAPKRRTTPAQFWNEVRAEGRKITWTSWKETWVTSVMVGIMVLIAAVFFMAVDGVLNFLVQQLLKLASG